MRVFSVEMLVKEEGAAVVEAALKRLKGETAAVAAEMKITTAAVTSTGRAMHEAGQATEVSGTRAAHAAIGFTAIGQSIARTGTLTASTGQKILTIGTDIAAMFGPTGLAVAAVLSAGVAIALQMRQTREEIEKVKKSFDELADVGNVKGIKEQLDRLVQGRPSQNYRDGIIALSTELANLKAKYAGVVMGIDDLTASSRLSLMMNEDLSAQEKKDLARIGQLNTELKNKNDLVARLQQLLPIASAVQDANTETTVDATKALKTYNDELERAVKRNAEVRGAIQEREATQQRGISTIGMTRFGTGLEAGTVKRMGAVPTIGLDTNAIARDVQDSINAVSDQLATVQIDQQLLDAMHLDTLQAEMAGGITDGIVGGIRSGVEMAIASGDIEGAFKAMGQGIIRGMASTMAEVAVKALKQAEMLKTIMTWMSNPWVAIPAIIALIAYARSLGGTVSGGTMTAIGSPSGLSYGMVGAAAPASQIIFGATSATTAAGMQPRSATNVTIIGPNDPSAQRAMQELLAKAESRGRIG